MDESSRTVMQTALEGLAIADFLMVTNNWPVLDAAYGHYYYWTGH